jgi:hypothetical protein
MTLSFLNDMLASSFLPAGFVSAADLLGFVLGEDERTKIPALLTCSHLSVLAAELDLRLFETITKGLDSDGSPIQAAAIEAVSILTAILSEEQRMQCFEKLVEIVVEGIDIATIEAAIGAVSRIVSADRARVQPTIALLERMIGGNVGFLGGLALSQVDTAVGLLGKVCALISTAIVPGTPLPAPIIEFLLEFLQRPSELDKCPAVDALSDAVLHDAVGPEARELIVSAVVAQIPAATDPALQENIIYLLNVLVMRDTVFVAPVLGLLEGLANWWTMALVHRSGYQDVIENLSSLFLAVAISTPQFPPDLIVQVFDQFPTENSEQTGPMCENLLLFVGRRTELGEPLVRSIGLSLARIFGQDRHHFVHMRIDDGLLERLRKLCLSLVERLPSLAPEIVHAAGKSRAKVARIAAILQR